MSFNQFHAVKIADDHTKIEIWGDSTDLPGDTTSIQVAIAHLPYATDPVEIFQTATFHRAQRLTGGELVNGWKAVYELGQADGYELGQMVLVVATVVAGGGTDVWAQRHPIISMHAAKET
jgi:hypothetical protein